MCWSEIELFSIPTASGKSKYILLDSDPLLHERGNMSNLKDLFFASSLEGSAISDSYIDLLEMIP
jgi:hypothetical protein